MWQKVFLNKAFLLPSRDSGLAVRISFALWLRTYHDSGAECKKIVGLRNLPPTKKTSFFFKSGSNQFLPIRRNHDEQVPLLRWKSDQERLSPNSGLRSIRD
jgi:hypothetical protein